MSQTIEPSAKSRKRADRREDVLRVAARVFSEHGFRQATLDDIARELKITRPALYYYADSKDKLLSECTDIAVERFYKALDEAQHAPTGSEQLRVFFMRYTESACDDFGRCF